MNRRSMFTLIPMSLAAVSIAFPARNAIAQQADMEGVKAASKAFYAALAVLDDGAAMGKVWAQTPYVTYVGPRAKSIMVGWDAQKKQWMDNNKLTSQRNVSLSDQRIHVNGNLAWEMGQESGTVKFKDGKEVKVDYIVTNVYEKLGDRWLMVSHHVQPKPQ